MSTSKIKEDHRANIGGLWEQMGKLQFNFLVENGLKPEHYLLDIGCGSLRGGVKFIKYLNEKHYYALEKEETLIEKAISKELNGEKDLFTYNLTGEFEIPEDWPQFDFMLAQSVFTHLLPEQINNCLTRVMPKCKGSFYATYFPSEKIERGSSHLWRSNERDIAKYPLDMFEELCDSLEGGVSVENIGGWNHPRGQHMLRFYNG